MIWARMEWVPILIVIPVLAIGVIAARRHRMTTMNLWISSSLWDKVVWGIDFIKQRRSEWLVIGAIFCLGLAILRPQYGVEYESLKGQGQTLFIALDTSQSMMARDFDGGRLEFAKQDINALINELSNDRVGLITFEGTSAVECPLTIDSAAVKLFVDEIQANHLPIPGTNLAAAIRQAIESYKKIPGRKTVVIFSDGENFEGNFRSAARDAKDAGIIIHTVGIGSSNGAEIPISDDSGSITAVRLDTTNRPILTRLNEGPLREIAALTGGQYIRVRPGQNAAPRLTVLLGKGSTVDYTAYLTPRYHDRYIGFALIGLICLLLEVMASTGIKLWLK